MRGKHCSALGIGKEPHISSYRRYQSMFPFRFITALSQWSSTRALRLYSTWSENQFSHACFLLTSENRPCCRVSFVQALNVTWSISVAFSPCQLFLRQKWSFYRAKPSEAKLCFQVQTTLVHVPQNRQFLEPSGSWVLPWKAVIGRLKLGGDNWWKERVLHLLPSSSSAT